MKELWYRTYSLSDIVPSKFIHDRGVSMEMISLTKKARFLFFGLLIFIVLHLYFGLGGLLQFSFFEPELMIENEFTNGKVNDSMRWLHFFAWLPTNIIGVTASAIGAYLAHLAHKGSFFTQKFGFGLWYLGAAVIVAALTDIFALSVVPHILSAENPAGQVPIQLSFSAEIFGLILCGIGFLALGSMMLEATRIADENKEFV